MKIYTLLLFSFFMMAFQTDKPAYRLFDKDGKSANYQALLEKALNADVVLFGESHNNPIVHWLQYELTKDLYQSKKEKLMLGAEMFETDNQLLLDEYLSGAIPEKNFEAEVRLWNNYQTDYKPLVEFAKSNELQFIATNIPRRYAAMVAKKGLQSLDSLSDEAKKLFMPLPIEIDLKMPAYANMLSMMGAHASDNNSQAANFAYAQAVKDATMAYQIAHYHKKDNVFIHFNGSYHSDNYESIMFFLKKYAPSLKVLTITSVDQTQLDSLEKKKVADFAIVTPTSMTKTY